MRKGARLGQHFLNAPWVARDLVTSLDIQNDEAILEIGPGKGALTSVLLATGNSVVAIEKDEALAAHLREVFAPEIATKRFALTEGDVRDFDPAKSVSGPYVLAANIPYYITGEIIRQFLETSHQPRAMALLIQKEVAERIVARDEKESILSLSVKAYGIPLIVKKVPKGCFNPPPSVDSAILLVKGISRTFFNEFSEKDFFTVVRAGFAAKRKLLAGNLSKVIPDARAALTACGIAEKARAEDVPLEKWGALARLIAR